MMALAEMVEQKMIKYPPAIRKALASELAGVLKGQAADNAGMSVDAFIAAALENRKIKQKPLPLAAIPPEFYVLADAIDRVGTAGKQLALDHDYTLHILDVHGGVRETLRGQSPIVADDMKYLADHLGLVVSVDAGDPPLSKNGAPRIVARVTGEAWIYDAVFEVRKQLVVPHTLWKRKK